MWLLIAIIAYFFLGLGNTIDKFLLTKRIPSPARYAFYVGILNLVAVMLLPFGVSWPGWGNLILSLVSGLLFVASLYFLYSALKGGQTSTVAPLAYGSTPIFLLVLSFIFLSERLIWSELVAFIFLIAGLILVSYQKEKSPLYKNIFKFFKIYDHHRPIYFALLSGLLFAGMNLINKIIYINLGFVSGLFWGRMGAVAAALIMLAIPYLRYQVWHKTKPEKNKAKTPALFIGNQVLAALGFVGVNYAISLASATIVSALQGLQYVFVFILVALLSERLPELKEKWTRQIIIQKIFAVVLIAIGLYFLNL